jgi:hypothetical protein
MKKRMKGAKDWVERGVYIRRKNVLIKLFVAVQEF